MIGISHPDLVFRKYSKLGTTRNWIAVGSRLEGAAFINGVVERCLHSFVYYLYIVKKKYLVHYILYHSCSASDDPGEVNKYMDSLE